MNPSPYDQSIEVQQAEGEERLARAKHLRSCDTSPGSYHCGMGCQDTVCFYQKHMSPSTCPLSCGDRHPRGHSAAEGHPERAGEVKAPACHACEIAPNGQLRTVNANALVLLCSPEVRVNGANQIPSYALHAAAADSFPFWLVLCRSWAGPDGGRRRGRCQACRRSCR